jgi:hypothetical protein
MSITKLKNKLKRWKWDPQGGEKQEDAERCGGERRRLRESQKREVKL